MNNDDERRNAEASQRECLSEAAYILQIILVLAIVIGLVLRFFGG